MKKEQFLNISKTDETSASWSTLCYKHRFLNGETDVINSVFLSKIEVLKSVFYVGKTLQTSVVEYNKIFFWPFLCSCWMLNSFIILPSHAGLSLEHAGNCWAATSLYKMVQTHAWATSSHLLLLILLSLSLPLSHSVYTISIKQLNVWDYTLLKGLLYLND